MSFPQLVRWIVLCLLAAYWLALVTATHLPTLPATIDMSHGNDKVIHFVAYAGLAFLAAAWRRGWKAPVTWRTWLFGGVALAGHAALDEILQMFVGRHADVRDALADVFGGTVGVATFCVVYPAWRAMRAWSHDWTKKKTPLAATTSPVTQGDAVFSDPRGA